MLTMNAQTRRYFPFVQTELYEWKHVWTEVLFAVDKLQCQLFTFQIMGTAPHSIKWIVTHSLFKLQSFLSVPLNSFKIMFLEKWMLRQRVVAFFLALIVCGNRINVELVQFERINERYVSFGTFLVDVSLVYCNYIQS